MTLFPSRSGGRKLHLKNGNDRAPINPCFQLTSDPVTIPVHGCLVSSPFWSSKRTRFDNELKRYEKYVFFQVKNQRRVLDRR